MGLREPSAIHESSFCHRRSVRSGTRQTLQIAIGFVLSSALGSFGDPPDVTDCHWVTQKRGLGRTCQRGLERFTRALNTGALVPTLCVGMPSWTLRVRICSRSETTQSVEDGIPTQSVGTR